MKEWYPVRELPFGLGGQTALHRKRMLESWEVQGLSKHLRSLAGLHHNKGHNIRGSRSSAPIYGNPVCCYVYRSPRTEFGGKGSSKVIRWL